MLVGGCGAPSAGADPETAVRTVLSLCRQREYRGVVLDLEQPPTSWSSRLIRRLEQGLAGLGRALFLPERYSRFSSRAYLFFSSSLSGGSFARRMDEMAAQYGANRLVLSLRRISEVFPLPAGTGQGEPLTWEALQAHMRRLEPHVFFSRDLCAHYFTYLSRSEGPRFVLFDTAESLRRKRDLAEKAGITRFFYLYPELKDLLPAILGKDGTGSAGD